MAHAMQIFYAINQKEGFVNWICLRTTDQRGYGLHHPHAEIRIKLVIWTENNQLPLVYQVLDLEVWGSHFYA